MPSLRFEEPLALALLLVLPALVLLPRTRLRTATTGQARAVLRLRVALTILLVLALSRPVLGVAVPIRALVFALDVSDSMPAEQQAWARQWVRQAVERLQPEDRWSVVEFGARAELATLDQTSRASDLPTNSTDLEGALRLAERLLPGDDSRDIVLLTDGWATDEQFGAPNLTFRGPRVSYVLPPQASWRPEVALREVGVQSALRVGEVLDLSATLSSALPSRAELRVTVDGQALPAQPLSLAAGSTRVTLPVRIRVHGFHTLRVEVVAEADTRLDNNLLEAATVASEAGRVLILEETPGSGAALAQTLATEALRVQTRPAASIPPSAAELGEFDSIVLVDVPATSLTLDQQRTLQSFVRDLGRGLVVIGGPHSFAPGGYEDTVLNEILPVSATPPPQRQQGSAALILVVDKSGSMENAGDNVSKMALAREAAIQATELLWPDDVLGVIAFDSAVQWVVPPGRLHSSDDIRQAQARIATIQSSGGTTILPALEAAFLAAAGADTRLKHVVLMTDGKSDDSEYPGLIQRMRGAGVTLSTVAVGPDAEAGLLEELATLGQGGFYFTQRQTEIPRIATKETTVATRDVLVQGQVAALARQRSPLLRGLSGRFPALGGYVATTPRERAVTALGTERGHPLLAHWQYGVGRVVAWTSDAGSWTPEWHAWPEFGRFWSQAVSWSMPGPRRPEFQVSAQVQSGRLTLQVQSLDEAGHYLNGQDTRATVVTPDGAALEVRLPQRAPGAYELTTEVSQPGGYRVVFQQRDGAEGGVLREAWAAFAVPGLTEQRSVGLNQPLLEALAERSGGRELLEPADLFRRSEASQGERSVPLWPYLLGLALLVLPFDVAARRLPWPWVIRGPKA